MSKKFQITVPEPCHENWDIMSREEKGRFCNSCQKTVMDFTGMNDEQLITYFKKPSTGSVCGRFMNDQLNREMRIPTKRIPWLKYFFQFTIPVFLAGMKSQAQGQVILKDKTEKITCSEQMSLGMIVKPVDKENINLDLLQGRILDEEGNPIPFSSIIIKGTKTGTISDVNGFFQIRLNESELPVTLQTSCIGFATKEFVVNEISDDTVIYRLTEFDAVINGEVVVCSNSIGKTSHKLGDTTLVLGGASLVKTSFIDKISELVVPKKIIATVFPNPVSASQSLTIKLDIRKDEEIVIQLYSFDGKLIRQELFKAFKGQNNLSFNTGNKLIPGVYLLKIKSKAGEKILQEKIVVQ